MVSNLKTQNLDHFRVIFWLPYVKLNDEKSVIYTQVYMSDQWIISLFSSKLLNMILHKEARTNNFCEGYNFKLGSKFVRS